MIGFNESIDFLEHIMTKMNLKILILIIVLFAYSGCRQGPRLDLGYKPATPDKVDQSSDKDKTSTANSGSASSSFDSDDRDKPILTIEDPWEPLTSLEGGLSARDEELEPEQGGRRWDPIFFAYNQSFIGETERKKLEVLADYLLKNEQLRIVVEGHCDARGSEEYNRALGEKRALSVRDYLVNLGVRDTRIRTISYGEERLVDESNTEQGNQRNRRAEFIIGLPKRSEIR